MAKVSINEAAKITGLSRSTLFRAVKSGKLSANLNENSDYEIDKSELARVYQNSSEETVAPPLISDELRFELVELRIKLDAALDARRVAEAAAENWRTLATRALLAVEKPAPAVEAEVKRTLFQDTLGGLLTAAVIIGVVAMIYWLFQRTVGM